MKEELFEKVSNAIAEGEVEEAVKLTKEGIEAGIPPLEIMEKGGTKGLQVVSQRFSDGTAYLPELILAGDAMTEILKLVLGELGDQAVSESLGKVIIGQVKGDLHDIGKNVVSALLSVNGFEVYDLGVDVDPKTFVDKAEEVGATIIASSTLLTTSMPYQEDVITYLKDAGLRDKYFCIVGGGPVTPDWAERIGADGYGRNATDAVELCKELVRSGKAPATQTKIVDLGKI
jgi:corrinoid protein of di/trimethylamine methyltransferase